jgi:hypothetical protein
MPAKSHDIRRRTVDEREKTRDQNAGRAQDDRGAGQDDVEVGTALEGKAGKMRKGEPGGGATIGAGRGNPELGNISTVGEVPDNTSGSDAGLGGGSGDLGGGGGLGDDLADLPEKGEDALKPKDDNP